MKSFLVLNVATDVWLTGQLDYYADLKEAAKKYSNIGAAKNAIKYTAAHHNSYHKSTIFDRHMSIVKNYEIHEYELQPTGKVYQI